MSITGMKNVTLLIFFCRKTRNGSRK